MFWRTIRVPSAMRMKSARPCTTTARSLFSITLGSTVYAGGSDVSPPRTNTFVFAHSLHSTSTGAWIASLTSFRLK